MQQASAGKQPTEGRKPFVETFWLILTKIMLETQCEMEMQFTPCLTH
jgi:hypothetical protein